MSEHVTKDADGLIGLKMLSLIQTKDFCPCPHCQQTMTKGPEKWYLQSPHQRTTWTSNTLSAKEWSNSSAVRGERGIHACWPWSLDELLRYTFGKNNALVELRGFGDTVQGDLGWRAQHAMLKKIWVNEHIDEIKKTYEAEVGLLDAWLTDFFLTRPISDECKGERIAYFFHDHVMHIRPSFLRKIYQEYRGPSTKRVRDAAFYRYNELQETNVLCELEL